MRWVTAVEHGAGAWNPRDETVRRGEHDGAVAAERGFRVARAELARQSGSLAADRAVEPRRGTDRLDGATARQLHGQLPAVDPRHGDVSGALKPEDIERGEAHRHEHRALSSEVAR